MRNTTLKRQLIDNRLGIARRIGQTYHSKQEEEKISRNIENIRKDIENLRGSQNEQQREERRQALRDAEANLRGNQRLRMEQAREKFPFRVNERASYTFLVRYAQVPTERQRAFHAPEDKENRLDRFFRYTISGRDLLRRMGQNDNDIILALNRFDVQGSGYGLDDNYDFDVYGVTENIEMTSDEFQRWQRGQAIAHHKFGIKNEEIEKQFQMFPLRLHDFPCIYESLMIIKYFIDSDGQKPPLTTASWIEYVIFSFNQEPLELVQFAMSGLVQPTIEKFNELHATNIGFFNIHKYREHYDIISKASILEDLEMLGVEDNKPVPQFFLAYWRSHVFPVKFEQLDNIREYMDKYIERFKIPNKQFCVVPGVIDFLKTAMNYWLAEFKQHDSIPHYFNDFPLDHVIPLFKLGNMQRIEEQQQFHDIVYNNRKTNEEILQILFAQKYTKQRGPAPNYSQIAAAYIRELRGRCWYPNDQSLHSQDELKEFIERRWRKVRKVGWCGIDIETLVDNSLEVSSCNFRPYCLSVYGRLQKLVRVKNERNMRWKVETVQIPPTSFYGLDCVNQFVMWLVSNNFIESDMNYSDDLAGTMSANYKKKKIENYFFAHNGFKFDYKFLYEQIYSKVGDMVIVGDIQQTKAFIGQGLNFYDSALFFPQTLESLARQFFPNDPTKRKLDGSVAITMTIEQYDQITEEEKHKIMRYCEQDALLVKEVSESFFGEVYTTPFGHGFTKRIVYHSAPSLAWDVWTNCFLTLPLFINPACQFAEKDSYRGGLSMVTKMYAKAAAVYDITSSYPEQMTHQMPALYVNQHRGPVVINPPLVFTPDDIEDLDSKITEYFLYSAAFEFPDDCLRPTIAIRTKDTMICPLTTSYRGELQYHWLWGCELQQAIRLGGASIRIQQVIEYLPFYTHRSFIEYMFNERLKYPEKEFPVKNKLFKLFMNSLYGKHGQQEFDVALVGSEVYTSEMLELLDLQNQELKNTSVTQILTSDIDLYQIKFKRNQGENNHKGTTVRIASYITAKARCHLFEGMYAIGSVYGLHNICYMDTDSLHVDISQCEPENAALIEQIIENGEFDEQQKYIQLLQTFRQTMLYTDTVTKLTIHSTKNGYTTRKNFYDDRELGGFKLEKLIVNAAYPGPKQYMYSYIVDYGDAKIESMSSEQRAKDLKIRTEVKLKGVPDKARNVQHVKEIIDNMRNLQRLRTFAEIDMCESNELPVRPFLIQSVFYRVGTGVSIAPALKLIRPTLSKCEYDLESGIGYPFKDIDQFYVHKEHFNKLMNYAKDRYKLDIADNPLLQALEKCQLMKAHQNTVKLSNRVKKFGVNLREELSKFVENRKKFMTQLPKIRYKQIHDDIYRALYQSNTIVLFYTHLHRLYVKAVECIKNMKLITKKGIHVRNGQEETREDKLRKIDDLDTAYIYAFMMFTKFICVMSNIEISPRLENIFKSLSYIAEVFQEDDNGEKYKQLQSKRHKMWSTNIALSLHFLSVPIALRKSGDDEQEIYTNLWRIYKTIIMVIRKDLGDTLTDIAVNEQVRACIQNKFEQQDKFEHIEPLAVADFEHFLLQSESDETQQLTFRTLEDNVPRIKIMKSALIPPVKEQQQEQQNVRDTIPTQQIDTGANILRKHNLIRVVAEIDTLDNENHIDKMGLLEEQHDILDILRESQSMATVYEKIITDEDDINALVNLCRNPNEKMRAQYRDMLNVICRIYIFLFHSGEVGRQIYQRYIGIYKKSLAQSERQQLFRAAETIFGEPDLLGGAQPSKNTHETLRKFIDVLIKYVKGDSNIKYDDFIQQVNGVCTKALNDKLEQLTREQQHKINTNNLIIMHRDNDHVNSVVKRILLNQIDEELIISERAKIQVVNAKMQIYSADHQQSEQQLLSFNSSANKHAYQCWGDQSESFNLCEEDDIVQNEPLLEQPLKNQSYKCPTIENVLQKNAWLESDSEEEEQRRLQYYQSRYGEQNIADIECQFIENPRKRADKANFKRDKMIKKMFFEMEAHEENSYFSESCNEDFM